MSSVTSFKSVKSGSNSCAIIVFFDVSLAVAFKRRCLLQSLTMVEIDFKVQLNRKLMRHAKQSEDSLRGHTGIDLKSFH